MLNIPEPEKQIQMPPRHLITAARAFTLKFIQERRNPYLEQLAAILIPGHLFLFLQSAHIFQNTPQGPRLVMPDFCRTVFPPPIRTHHANPIIGTILALVVGCHRSNVVQRSKSINNKHKKPSKTMTKYPLNICRNNSRVRFPLPPPRCCQSRFKSRSSSGPGLPPFTRATRVRVPYAMPALPPRQLR